MNAAAAIEDRPRVNHKRSVEELSSSDCPQVKIRKIKRCTPPKGPAIVPLPDIRNVSRAVDEFGVIHCLKTFMFTQEDSKLQLDYLCRVRPFDMVTTGGLPILVEALNDSDELIKERATRCLAQLAGLDEGLRDMILQEDGLLTAMTFNIDRPRSTSLGLSCLELIISFLDHRNKPSLAIALEWSEFLSYLIFDMDPIVKTVRAISLFSEYSDLIFPDPMLRKLVSFLRYEELALVELTMTTLSNVVASHQNSIQVLLGDDVLKRMVPLLKIPQLQESICFVLSKIANGTPEQLGKLCRQRSILRHLAELVSGNHPFPVKAAALNVITIVVKQGRDPHVYVMYENRCVLALCDGLQFVWDIAIIKSILESLTIVLEVSHRNDWNYIFRAAKSGLELMVDELVNNPNSIVSNMSARLLDTYFREDEYYDHDDEEENYAPVNESMVQSKTEQVSSELQAPRDSVSSFGTVKMQLMNA